MNFSLFLQNCPLFSRFTASELDALERAMSIRHFPDGYVFMREGERAGTLYLIVDGQVVVTRRRAGGRGIDAVHTMGPGEMFGLLALIDQHPRAASCTARGPVQAASLPRAVFQLLCHTSAPIALHFQMSIARQLASDSRVAHEALRRRYMGDDAEAEVLFRRLSHDYDMPERRRAAVLMGSE